MEKKYIKKLLILLGLMFGISIQIIVNTYTKDEKILCSVFAGSNVVSAQGELMLQGRISKQYMTEKDIEEMLKYIAKLAGVEKSKVDNNEGMWHLEGECKGIKLTIDTDKFNEAESALIRIKIFWGNKEEVYNSETLINIRREINKFFLSVDIEKLEDNLILKGCYMGKLSNQFINDNTNKMYKELEGDEITKEYSDGVFFSYGYTDKIEEYIITESNKININIVYTYDEETNQTWIYLGSPIINIDY